MPAVRRGLQKIHCADQLREQVIGLIETDLFRPTDRDDSQDSGGGWNRHVGRPGRTLWSDRVLALVKPARHCDFDRPADLDSRLESLRRMLGPEKFAPRRCTVLTAAGNGRLLSTDRRRVVRAGLQLADWATRAAAGPLRLLHARDRHRMLSVPPLGIGACTTSAELRRYSAPMALTATLTPCFESTGGATLTFCGLSPPRVWLTPSMKGPANRVRRPPPPRRSLRARARTTARSGRPRLGAACSLQPACSPQLRPRCGSRPRAEGRQE